MARLKALPNCSAMGMAVGSDTVNAAAKLYGYVKVGAKDNPGLKPIAEQLGKAFKRANAKATPALAEKK